MLADEDDFLHAVSVDGIPVAAQILVAFHHHPQLFLGHGGEPQATVLEGLLASRLFEEPALVNVIGEVTQAFGTDDIGRPVLGHHVVELVEVCV